MSRNSPFAFLRWGWIAANKQTAKQHYFLLIYAKLLSVTFSNDNVQSLQVQIRPLAEIMQPTPIHSYKVQQLDCSGDQIVAVDCDNVRQES